MHFPLCIQSGLCCPHAINSPLCQHHPGHGEPVRQEGLSEWVRAKVWLAALCHRHQPRSEARQNKVPSAPHSTPSQGSTGQVGCHSQTAGLCQPVVSSKATLSITHPLCCRSLLYLKQCTKDKLHTHGSYREGSKSRERFVVVFMILTR